MGDSYWGHTPPERGRTHRRTQSGPPSDYAAFQARLSALEEQPSGIAVVPSSSSSTGRTTSQANPPPRSRWRSQVNLDLTAGSQLPAHGFLARLQAAQQTVAHPVDPTPLVMRPLHPRPKPKEQPLVETVELHLDESMPGLSPKQEGSRDSSPVRQIDPTPATPSDIDNSLASRLNWFKSSKLLNISVLEASTTPTTGLLRHTPVGFARTILSKAPLSVRPKILSVLEENWRRHGIDKWESLRSYDPGEGLELDPIFSAIGTGLDALEDTLDKIIPVGNTQEYDDLTFALATALVLHILLMGYLTSFPPDATDIPLPDLLDDPLLLNVHKGLKYAALAPRPAAPSPTPSNDQPEETPPTVKPKEPTPVDTTFRGR